MADAVQENADILYIQMLGGFELRCGEHVIGDSANRSYQLWNLLEYLIAYRKQEVSQTNIIEALWHDDSSDNPANALKNLVYRIRTTLTAADFPHSRDLIQYTGGTYSLRSSLPIQVDSEVFESLCKKAALSYTPEEERLSLLLQAIDLYKGDFLPRSQYEPWVVPITTYYHGLYLRSVDQAIALLWIQQKAELITPICEKALMVDPFEEKLHVELIRSLIAQNRQKQAMERYQQATELFYREMGVKPSESLRDLYRDIIKTVNMVETDLEIIKEDLRENSRRDGPFFCEYEVFKNMYQLETRTTIRTGQAVYIGLLTLSPVEEDQLDLKLLNIAMERLQEALHSSLRQGDVVSRFSTTQYVTMLPTLTYENGQLVLDRIAKKFSGLCRNSMARLHTTLQPLDPIM